MENQLTPYNLVKGRSYFIESGMVKWYVTNNSFRGSKEKSGFCISVNGGYNDSGCYVARDAQFFRDSKSPHAYENMYDVQIRELTDDEGQWFAYCKDLNKFVPYDSVIKIPSLLSLKEFPRTGMCWKPTKELLDYLQTQSHRRHKGESLNIQNIITYQQGLVWNENSIWMVSSSSSYKEYSIEELNKFLPVPAYLKQYPLTPEECHFPKKWSIRIDKDNCVLIENFLKDHSKEYDGHNASWKPTKAIGRMFVYPQEVKGSYVLWTSKSPDYTEITTEQFKKHVLTHTDKQQQINESSKTKKDDKENTTGAVSTNSCKIQRSNITIGDTAPIRGVGLKCPKIQVKIGSGYLPD